jgi:3-oxoacyl-[acyl-carrier protein] reductase
MPTAIVTGCLGAIGAATCSALTADGHDIIGVDRPRAAPFKYGAYYQCDLADAAAVSELLEALRPRRRSRIDLLVNNAGHYDPKPFFETTLEDFDLAFRVNVRAVFQLSQAVASWMASDGGGSIVNIASIAGKLGSPVVPYGASKAAVIGLTRSMAKSLAGQGVRVNAVAPGMIRSPMSEAIAEPQMRAQLANTAMGRLGEPQEIARVVAFLASPAASYMTGAVVDVTGGWMS